MRVDETAVFRLSRRLYMYCSNKYCKRKDEDLEEGEFQGRFGKTKQCALCRKEQNEAAQRGKKNLRVPEAQQAKIEKGQGRPPTKGMKDDTDLPIPSEGSIKPGQAPTFGHASDEERYRQWRANMAAMVRASSNS